MRVSDTDMHTADIVRDFKVLAAVMAALHVRSQVFVRPFARLGWQTRSAGLG